MSDGTVKYQLKKFDCGCEWEVACINGEIVGINYEPEKAPLNCPKIWSMLCSGKTKGIFQLETPLGQSSSKKCMPYGIEELSDLISILRPGTSEAEIEGKTLKARYIDRKMGKEEAVPPHPALYESLKDTQMIGIYQETYMDISRRVAGFSEEESYSFLKTVAKKLPEKMAQFKQKFIDGCISYSNLTEEDAEFIFSLLEAGQRYAFNKCLALDTEVKSNRGIRTLYDLEVGDQVMTPTGWANIIDKINTGEQPVYRVELESGKYIDCTIHHKFMCEDNKIRPLYEIVDWAYRIQTKDGLENIQNTRILGILPTIDIEIDNDNHIYYANNIATSNSHSIAYALNSVYFSAYPKVHFPRVFFLTELEYARGTLKETVIEERGKIIDDAKDFGVNICKPDLRLMNPSFLLKDKVIYYGLAKIKGVGDAKFKKLEAALVGKNVEELSWLQLLYVLCKTSSDAVKNLIYSGALDFVHLTRSRMVFEFSVFKRMSDAQQQFLLQENSLKEGLEKLAQLPTGKGQLIYNKSSLKKVVDILNQYNNAPVVLKDSKRKIFNWEMELLGGAFTATEIDDEEIGNCSCEQFINHDKKLDEYQIPAIINTVKTYITKGKDPREMAFVNFKDGGLSVKGVVFPDAWIEYKHRLFEGNKAVMIGSRGQDNSLVIKRVFQL